MIIETIQSIDIPAAVAASGSVTDAANNAFDEISTTLLKGGGTIALGFVIFKAVKARGTLTAILTAGLAAGLFLWLITGGYTWIQDRINGQGKSISATVEHTQFQSPNAWDLSETTGSVQLTDSGNQGT